MSKITDIKDKITAKLPIGKVKEKWSATSKYKKLAIVGSISFVISSGLGLAAAQYFKYQTVKNYIDSTVKSMYVMDMYYDKLEASIFSNEIILTNVSIAKTSFAQKMGMGNMFADEEGRSLATSQTITISDLNEEEGLFLDAAIQFDGLVISQDMINKMPKKPRRVFEKLAESNNSSIEYRHSYDKETGRLAILTRGTMSDVLEFSFELQAKEAQNFVNKANENVTRYFVVNSNVGDAIQHDGYTFGDIFEDARLRTLSLNVFDDRLTTTVLQVYAEEMGISEDEASYQSREFLGYVRDDLLSSGADIAADAADDVIPMIKNRGGELEVEIDPDSSKTIKELVADFANLDIIDSSRTGFDIKISYTE